MLLASLCCCWIFCRFVLPEFISFLWRTQMLPCLLLNLSWQKKGRFSDSDWGWMLPVEWDQGINTQNLQCLGLVLHQMCISLLILFMPLFFLCLFLSSFLYFTVSQAVTHRFKVILCFSCVPLGLCLSWEVWWEWRYQQLISWKNLCAIFQHLYSSTAQQVLWQTLNQQVVQQGKAFRSLTFLTELLSNQIFPLFFKPSSSVPCKSNSLFYIVIIWRSKGINIH